MRISRTIFQQQPRKELNNTLEHIALGSMFGITAGTVYFVAHYFNEDRKIRRRNNEFLTVKFVENKQVGGDSLLENLKEAKD